ncbi:hypothetical protein TIFTF001_039281 [Ficus carica]|uniref:Transposase MuDR plant domain-containing protein n=1 Tax=Ficus carica TaxID=3494 RepID=A0AA88JEX3_FICCA|nr:hypothetical protein TIFTF001_039281 [Ficus carica]
MEDVCVFVEYNGQWDGTQSYVGGEMKGILVPEPATYVGLIKLVRSTIGIRGPAKTIVMRFDVEPGLPLVRIQCDADVKFYIQLKKKDVHVLSKFPITIDILDESAAETMPPELGESNDIDVQLPTVAVQSDVAIQHVDDRNWTFPPPPSPPHIPHLPPHVDESKFAGYARQSNENSIAASIGAHSIANYTTSQSVNVPSSDSLSGSLVVADYTPVTIRINSIFENKKLLQYHLHHDAMSKHYQFKVKRSNSTLLHVICIDIEKCQWQLRATRMRGSELFVVKRYDDVHTCSIEIVQGHHRQAKSWMIGECVKEKYLDPTNTSYRPREIMRDMQAEFGVSFNYLRAWRGKEAALTSLRGDDAESYNARSYLVSEHQRHMESIRNRNLDMHRYLVQADPTKRSRAYFNGRRYAIMTTNIAESLNNVDRKARLMPVGFLVEWLRELQQRWFVARREEAIKLTSKLAPKAEKLIRTNFSVGLLVTVRDHDHIQHIYGICLFFP